MRDFEIIFYKKIYNASAQGNYFFLIMRKVFNLEFQFKVPMQVNSLILKSSQKNNPE